MSLSASLSQSGAKSASAPRLSPLMPDSIVLLLHRLSNGYAPALQINEFYPEAQSHDDGDGGAAAPEVPTQPAQQWRYHLHLIELPLLQPPSNKLLVHPSRGPVCISVWLAQTKGAIDVLTMGTVHGSQLGPHGNITDFVSDPAASLRV
jgi:hypothetical protein